MNIFKLLKTVTGGIGSTTKLFTNSMKGIDRLIEKEYITGTIDKAKGLTGDVVQKSGELLELGKMKVEELREQQGYKPIGETVKVYKDKIIELSDNLSDQLEEKINAYHEEEE